jgi:hypothetical protein
MWTRSLNYLRAFSVLEGSASIESFIENKIHPGIRKKEEKYRERLFGGRGGERGVRPKAFSL